MCVDKLEQIRATSANGFSANVGTSLSPVFSRNERRRALILNSSGSTGLFWLIGNEGNQLYFIFIPQNGAPVIIDFARFGTWMQELVQVKTASGTFAATAVEITDSGPANPGSG